MFYFDLTASILGFVGTIVFAAALIKTPEQIRDETQAYWDENPYTTDYGLKSQPYFLVAFLLLITSFSIGLGSKIGYSLARDKALIAILLSTSISLIGYLATILLYERKRAQHQKKKLQQLKMTFRRQVEANRHTLRQKRSDTQNFEGVSGAMKAALTQRLNQIPETDRELEREHLSDVNSSQNFDDLLEASERFLSQNQSKH